FRLWRSIGMAVTRQGQRSEFWGMATADGDGGASWRYDFKVSYSSLALEDPILLLASLIVPATKTAD
ncbi:hypothetical protein chiPu_0018191, partial [Chiloscyllium punctatum]|nr:hypothetical protein [Chiloscyllium punctatum]